MVRVLILAMGAALVLVLGAAPLRAQKPYITNFGSNNVSVIDTTTNAVIGNPITVGTRPFGLAVTPDGSKVYVANNGSNTVSVIDTATNTMVGMPIQVDFKPLGVAVTPDGSKVYVANNGSNTVWVIDTDTTVIVSTIAVGTGPYGMVVGP
jgi:YVTN family beta-propeller protein